MSTGYYMRSVPDLKFGSNKKCTIFNVTGSNDTVKLPAFENPPLLDRLLYKLSYSQFCVKYLNFRYHGNEGRSEEKFKGTIKLVDIVNPRFDVRISDIAVTHAGLCVT